MKKHGNLRMTAALAVIVSLLLTMMAGGASVFAESAEEPLKFSLIDNNLDIADYSNAVVWQEINRLANVDIEFISAEGNYDDKISLLYVSNSLPDLFYTAMNDEFEKKGTAKFTLDEFRTYMPGMYEGTLSAMDALGVNQETTWKRYLVGDDTIFGVPGIWFEGQLGHGIVWRQDLLTEMGFDAPPATIEDMEVVLAKWKELHPEWYGYGANKDSARMFDMVFGATGAPLLRWVIEDDVLVPGWVRPENTQALETLQRWYELGYIDREFMTKENFKDADAFYNGRSIVQPWSEWADYEALVRIEEGMSSNFDALFDINPGAELVAGPVPTYAEGLNAGVKPATLAWRAFHGNTIGFSVNLDGDRDRLHAIMERWDFICTNLCELVLYGLEGTHYEISAEGERNYIAPFNDNMVRNNEGIGCAVLSNNTMVMQQFQSVQKNNAIARFFHNADAMYSVNNVTPVPSGVSTIYDEAGNDLSAKYQDLINMRDTIFMEIITGQKPVSAYEDYIATWKANGGEELELHANRLYRHLY